VAAGRHTAPRGHTFVFEQASGSAGVTPPPLLGPLHWPCVGAVTPWALANVTFQYVTPSQPHAHPCSPDFRGDGLSTQLPGLVQSGASQYSLGRQSVCAVDHAQAFLTPFDPSPDGSGPPKIEVHPALSAITTARVNRPQRFVPDASGAATGALPVAPSFPRRRRFILGFRATAPKFREA